MRNGDNSEDYKETERQIEDGRKDWEKSSYRASNNGLSNLQYRDLVSDAMKLKRTNRNPKIIKKPA
jgi:hypothetical protein